MLTLTEKIELFLKVAPWGLLMITWIVMYCNYEERKARKENIDGNSNQ